MTGIDVKKALQQHLDSLQWSGLGHVASNGDLKFDLAGLESAEPTQQPPKAPPVADRTAGPGSDEAKPNATAAVPQSPTPTVPQPPTPTPAPTPQLTTQTSPATPIAPIALQGDYGPVISDPGQRQSSLDVIAGEVAGCTLCPELCGSRQNTVFGTGPADAKIVFLGEGPGTTEDQQGEPFVGAAGQLLNKILNASTLNRDQVYILNVVKCRPPGDRNPSEAEIQNCQDYLQRQLNIIQPTHIVCLGSVAAKSLLNTKNSLGKLRKRFHQYRSSKVIVTYHPTYLLQTPGAKKHVWEDMKLLMKDLGVDL